MVNYAENTLLHHTKYLEIDGYDELKKVTRRLHAKIHCHNKTKIPISITSNAYYRLKKILKNIEYTDIYGDFCLTTGHASKLNDKDKQIYKTWKNKQLEGNYLYYCSLCKSMHREKSIVGFTHRKYRNKIL